VLAKKESPDGSSQLYVFKILKKTEVIDDCNVSFITTEKDAVILACGHPFITTLYSCVQTKVIFNVLNLLRMSEESVLKFTISIKCRNLCVCVCLFFFLLKPVGYFYILNLYRF
jgi:hypothetical protein